MKPVGLHLGVHGDRMRRVSQGLFVAFLVNEGVLFARTPAPDRRRAPTPRFPVVTIPLSLTPLFVSVRLSRRVRRLIVTAQVLGLVLELGSERQLIAANSFSTAPDAATEPQVSLFYRYLEHPIYVGVLAQLVAFSIWFPPALVSTALTYESLKRAIAAERTHLATLGAHHRGIDSVVWG